MGVHELTGLGVGVADCVGRDAAFAPTVRAAELNPRLPHRLQGVPRHDDFEGCVGAELQMQTGHRGSTHQVAAPGVFFRGSCRTGTEEWADGDGSGRG
jgi:hypothetical protein